jgi:hypothetical protein
MGLAVDYSNATRPPGEAMALVREANELLRPLAGDLPGVHRSTLTQMLHNLAWEQFDAGTPRRRGSPSRRPSSIAGP